jgi:hypothetical protein
MVNGDMTNMRFTKDTMPVFEYEIPKELIDNAFLGAIELFVANETLKENLDTESRYIIANKNIDGSKISTKVNFVSTVKSHIKNSKIGELANYIEKLVKQMSLDHYSADVNFKVHNSTVLMYKGGDNIGKHNHFPYCFVVAIYLNMPENASPISLGESLEIHPKAGTCLIFPGNLYHEVKQTEADRIMITMDIKVVIED